MFFYLLVTILIGYELQVLIQGNTFFRITDLHSRYKKQLKKHQKSKAWKAIIKIGFFNLFYIILIIVGLFGYNYIFFWAIIGLSILQEVWRSIFKRIIWRRILYTLDTIICIALLSLSLVNYMYFKVDSIIFVHSIISKI